MAIGYTWNVSTVDTYPTKDSKNDVVYNVHWRLTATDDTNKDSGGLAVYEDSHRHGYFDHTLDHPDKDKGWTKQYTHVSKEISSKFKRKELEVKAGSAVLMISSCLHCGYPNKTKESVRITICERFNPLQKIPYLKDPKATMKIPYMGVDYNKISD